MENRVKIWQYTLTLFFFIYPYTCRCIEIKDIPVILHKNYPYKILYVCILTPLELTTSPDNDFNFQWQFNGSNIASATNITYYANQAGNYTIKKIRKSNGQIFTSDPFQIILKTALDPIKIKYNKKIYCENEKAILKIESPYKSAEWFTKTVNFGLNDSIEVNQSDRYIVKYGGNNGCPAVKDSVEIVFNPLPENPTVGANQFFSCRNDDFELIIPQKNIYKYQWEYNNTSISNATKANLKTKQWGNYRVKITDKATGCQTYSNDFILSEDPACAIIEQVFIPNAFSPNADSINDIWEVKRAFSSEDYELFIYNRIGNIVYCDKKNIHQWDGTYKGSPVEAGIYFYKIILENGKIKQGSIWLLR